MISVNGFPESLEKSYLRHAHLKWLASRSQALGRSLAYLGLPSAEMHDVKLWKSYLRHITAVERDPNLAMHMYRTAILLGIRSKTIIIEKNLAEAARLLAIDERNADLSVAALYSADQDAIRRARSMSYDVINIDLYGGFLYPNDRSNDDKNTEILRDLISHQTRHRSAFNLLLTFNLRDTGRAHYLSFISNTMQQLRAANVDTQQLDGFYTSTQKVNDQSPNLIRLRFCVPAFIHKTAFENFEVRMQGAWVYKTFYHASLVLEPRQGVNSLGLSWPPIDEFKRLLRAPLIRLSTGDTAQSIDDVQTTTLFAPTLP